MKGDNSGIGTNGAAFLIDRLGGSGRMFMLSGPPVSVTTQRDDGFRAGIAGSDIEVVGLQDGGYQRERGYTVMQNALVANPEIDAIFSIDDEMALGALQAVKEAGRTDIRFITGAGGEKNFFDAIMEEDEIEMIGISKTFGATVRALVNVDSSVRSGEVHALLGENGAGKSTLVNILGGVVQRDSGTIKRYGNAVEIRNSQDARGLNVSFIHQELNLVPDLRVYENIFLGEGPRTPRGFLDSRRMIRETGELLERLDISISPTAVVRDLGATFKQVVEIAGAIRQDSDVIIMDEPTTSLTDHEIEHLFTMMRTLTEHGVSIIFISHKLKEVFAICDRYTILRDGKTAGSGAVADVGEEDIVRMMVGRDLAGHEFYTVREVGKPILEVDRLSCGGSFRDVSFTVRRGEVLGFTGLAGDGRSELFEAIFGARTFDRGEIRIQGKSVRIPHPSVAVKNGIGYAPRNRKENAIIHDLKIVDNVSLPSLKTFERFGLIDRSEEIANTRSYAERMRLRYGSLTDPILSLSGGNQQKVVVAKWLEAGSDIIVFDNPTQGIDVGAKSEIYELIMELAGQGRSIVVLSSEFNEVMRLCDRIYVMYHGALVAELDRNGASEENLMMYSTGVKSMDKEAINR